MKMDSDGDIISKLKLDVKDFEKALAKAQKSAEKFSIKLGKTPEKAKTTTDSIHKLQQELNIASVAQKKLSGGLGELWKRFGAVAVGFNVVYRALNLFNDGVAALAIQAATTITVLDDFEKRIISITATIVSFSKVADPFEALVKSMPEVRSIMQELEIIAAQHLVTAEEMLETYSALVKKRLVPITAGDLQNVATIADAIKLVAEHTGQSYQYMQEVYSLMDGTAGKGRQLANFMKAMYPDLKKQIDAWQQMGTDIEGNNILLQKIGESFKGLKAAQTDILKLWSTQYSTVTSYWDIIRRLGGADIYGRAASQLKEINDQLVDAGGYTENMYGIAALWSSFLESGYQSIKAVTKISAVLAPNAKEIAFAFSTLSNTLIITRSLIQTIAVVLDKTLKAVWWSIFDFWGRSHNVLSIIGSIPGEIAGISKEALADMTNVYEAWAKNFEVNSKKMRVELEKLLASMKQQKETEEVIKLRDKWTKSLRKAISTAGIAADAFKKLKAGELNTESVDRYIRRMKELAKLEDVPENLAKAYMMAYDAQTKAELKLQKYVKHMKDLKRIQDEMLLKTGTLLEGWIVGIDNVEQAYGTAFEQMVDLSETTATSMRDAFKTWFIDISKQDIKNWSDYLDMVGNAVAQKFADQMANMLLSETGLQKFFGRLFKSSAGWAGGVTPTGGSVPVEFWHDGGIVGQPLMPRLHNGLAADEFPAILQSGETVLPRGVQPNITNKYNINITAVDTQSFDDAMRRHPQSVLGPLMEAIEQGDRPVINRLRSVV